MLDLVASCGCVSLLDQWSKRMIEVHAPSYRKRGRALGNQVMLILLWLLALASSMLLLHSGARFQSHIGRIAIGSALGGAAGNLLDTWRRGFIVDFIDLRVWPVFNVADVAIAAGIVLSLWPGIH
jgi:lipoprotein signal peptidase